MSTNIFTLKKVQEVRLFVVGYRIFHVVSVFVVVTAARIFRIVVIVLRIIINNFGALRIRISHKQRCPQGRSFSLKLKK